MSKSNNFYNLETIGGILLFFAAALAIIIANSPLNSAYEHLLHIHGSFTVGNFSINKPLILWINDGLMAIYFLMIGLEIKREIHRGILSEKSNLLVPLVTAFSGLFFPALIFILFNAHNPVYLKGWAIPTATDIAFSLGIIALLGSRVPYSLKVLVTAIAIFDDIAAITIIAIFYTEKLSLLFIGISFALILILVGLNYFNCRRISVFAFFGLALWVAVLESGIHATIAGIVIAMTIPDSGKSSMLTRLENGLHYWVVFIILPVFAFANAGVSLIGFDLSVFINPIVLGVGLGLFLGKQIGIFISLGYFIKFKQILKSNKVNLKQVYGISLICGVGFTMSLFIGSLAYLNSNSSLMPLVRIGVIFGSLISGLSGFLVLRINSPREKRKTGCFSSVGN
ncbi:sodium-proton antiporter [Legionella wadsworthii]|uniref:Na(+)/H(+) antiporter NhaA n=1 Tax=Legionella wadsworthii TaxID=28088 RepID=A0A378LR29_9GAMM|nr:Na+/H+ antiporter NhaA [Legionella wadsworthii]STY28820.1 sodium-proton antiporter [Legionella wadsworthii]